MRGSAWGGEVGISVRGRWSPGDGGVNVRGDRGAELKMNVRARGGEGGGSRRGGEVRHSGDLC